MWILEGLPICLHLCVSVSVCVCVCCCLSFCLPVTFWYMISLHFSESVHWSMRLSVMLFSLPDRLFCSPVGSSSFSHFIQHLLWRWDLTLLVRKKIKLEYLEFVLFIHAPCLCLSWITSCNVWKEASLWYTVLLNIRYLHKNLLLQSKFCNLLLWVCVCVCVCVCVYDWMMVQTKTWKLTGQMTCGINIHGTQGTV